MNLDKCKKTVCDLFISRTNDMPGNMAIGSFRSNKIKFQTFKEYRDTVEAISVALINLGVSSQKKVSILAGTRKEWHFFDMAILCSGAVTVPVYHTYTPEEVEYIINHSDSEFLIVENESQFEKILAIQKKLTQIKTIFSIENISSSSLKKLNKKFNFVSFEECKKIGASEVQNHPDKFSLNIENISPESLATIIYTSGTTGQPKGAMINHIAIFQVLYNLKKFSHNAIYENDRCLTYLPLSHVLGRLESFFPILFGAQAVYAQDIKKILSNITTAKPTILIAVPRVLEKIHEKAMKTIEKNEISKNIFEYANNCANNYFN
ncbi:MAG: AMP-binding protein, partial [Halobacteriovoraceae bacterium]|nr:AMP-binding protein [Halobacteriovoraceae bacterium]